MNVKNYTPLVAELADLHIWQRDISRILMKKVANSDGDEKLLALLNSYVEKIEQLDDTLREISISAEYSFEEEPFKKFIQVRREA